MEIDFPIEFLVRGTPVSLQTKRGRARDEWKQRVREASTSAIPSPHFATYDKICVTIFYLPEEPMQGDIDNIIKPILDALCRHIYLDDQQVERVVVQKFEPGSEYVFSDPTVTLDEAWRTEKPVLYVRISNDPSEELR
jgi:crossover junction endodeoxyribonuclease RusA